MEKTLQKFIDLDYMPLDKMGKTPKAKKISQKLQDEIIDAMYQQGWDQCEVLAKACLIECDDENFPHLWIVALGKHLNDTDFFVLDAFVKIIENEIRYPETAHAFANSTAKFFDEVDSIVSSVPDNFECMGGEYIC